MSFRWWLSGLVLAAVPAAAAAQQKDDPSETAIVVTARKLDQARDAIQPSLGASSFGFSRETLDVQPGGSTRTLSQTLVQAPGVTQDADGDIHIRNEHGNLQYRLNGVIIPESSAGMDSVIDLRIAESVELVTGTLPAQYGYRTAGVINLKTRTSELDDDGAISLVAGDYGQRQGNIMLHGDRGATRYFASATYERSDLGVENPVNARAAIHDRNEAYRGFVFVSHILGDSDRISGFAGTSSSRQQIPNIPGVAPSYTAFGRTTADSAALDQNQQGVTHFGVVAWQHAAGDFNLQVAPFARWSLVRFTPDPAGNDILFNGSADTARLSSLAIGAQADASLKLNDAHTLRFGLFVQNERTRSDVTTRALPADANGNQTSDIPVTIADHGGRDGQLYGVYVQDEWGLTDRLTLNYGLRYDAVRAYTSEEQLSPRINMVWKAPSRTTLHIGYARNFTPPPQELITPAQIALYNGTVRQMAVQTADPVKAERENYFDAGIEQKIGRSLTLAIDSYYKVKRNLLDEGQFGTSLISSPFNYAHSTVWGVELRADYTTKNWNIYANVARGEQKARRINSSQYFFDPAELAYIANHDIYTDHSQKWTVSGGISGHFDNGPGRLEPAIDMIYGDGQRAADPAGIVPNGGKLPGYVVVNASLGQEVNHGPLDGLEIRFNITNLFDAHYLQRDGSGVGLGAPQWGKRRSFTIELTKSF